MESSNKTPKLPPPNKGEEEEEEEDDDDILDTSMRSPSLDTESSPSLEMMTLPDDCLRAVLIRTCAADHDSLRQTCKRVLSILDSFVFRQERALLGYTEVQRVRLLPAIEQYKKDYADEYDDNDDDKKSLSSQDTMFQNEYDELGMMNEYGRHEMGEHFRVFVDGKRIELEGLKVHLLPLKYPFFEMCDIIEDELVTLGNTCFNNRGGFRLKSLKEAVPEPDKRPLLYISQFSLPEEYRSLASPVGPLILKSLLFETLANRWSIAMYIPHHSAQLSKHDINQSDRMRDVLDPLRQSPLSAEEIELEKEWEDRLVELTKQDMRQFFRAGFHQVKDVSVIEDSSDYYVFATPKDAQPVSSIGQQQHRSIFSEKDALQVEISLHPPPPPKKSKEQEALFDLLRSSTTTRQELVREKTIYISENAKPCRELESLKPLFEEFDKNMREFEESIGTHERMKQRFEETRESVTLLPTKSQQKEALENLYGTVIVTGLYDLPPRSLLTVESFFNPLLRYHARTIEELQAAVSQIEETLSKLEDDKQGEVTKTVAGMDERIQGHDMQVNKKLQEFFENRAEGSDGTHRELIIKSCAIHVCAFSMEGQPYIQSLLEMMPLTERHEAMNSRDEHDLTPLMVAVNSEALGVFDEQKRHEMCAFLINNGADVNLETRRGLTALGRFRQYRKKMEDFHQTFGARYDTRLRIQLELNDALAGELESLIRPAMGPTAADEAVFCDEDSFSEERRLLGLDEDY